MVMTGAAAGRLVDGPAWNAAIPAWGQGGRYPLRVESWLLQRTGRLVPGVISTTPIARQYTLHCLVAAEVERAGLDAAEAAILAYTSANDHEVGKDSVYRRVTARSLAVDTGQIQVFARRRQRLEGTPLMFHVASSVDSLDSTQWRRGVRIG
jgi:hypothetical protein